jgi:hypothetical protein
VDQFQRQRQAWFYLFINVLWLLLKLFFSTVLEQQMFCGFSQCKAVRNCVVLVVLVIGGPSGSISSASAGPLTYSKICR